MKRKRGFTMYELLISLTIFALVITLVLKFYMMMIANKRGLEGRQILIENSYHLMERLQVQMKNYTIDYEEYFNRRLNGCDKNIGQQTAADFKREVGENGYCDKFTNYGNNNEGLGIYPTQEHHLYYCSSLISENIGNFPNKIYQSSDHLRSGSGCFINASMINNTQSFGQYKKQFFDVNQNADTVSGSANDDDDEDLGIGPTAIGDNKNTKELYLISKNNGKRMFIRRALISSGDFDGTGGADKDSEKRYTLQILNLKGFDIGSDHNLDNNSNSGAYDGQIDTRACDYGNGFECGGEAIGVVYSGYKLPKDINDGRINIFAKNLTLSKRNLEIYPTSNPLLSWNKKNMQINPYIKIGFQSKLYGKQRFYALPNVDVYTFSLQSTFDTKSFY